MTVSNTYEVFLSSLNILKVFSSSTHHPNKLPGQLHDGHLAARPHVVDFSRGPFLQDQQESVHGVADEQEVAGLGQSSLDGAAAERADEVFTLKPFLSSIFVNKKTNPEASVPFLVHLQEGEEPGNDLKDQDRLIEKPGGDADPAER